MAEYSYLVLHLPREASRDVVRRILTDHAEYGHWELARMRLYADGSRKATLRRQIIRQGRASELVRIPPPGLGSWPQRSRGAWPGRPRGAW